MRTERDSLIFHYRWEFLRRNSGFRREFDSFSAQFSQRFGERWWYDPEVKYNQEERLFQKAHVDPEAVALKRRWRVERLVPYTWEFDKTGKYELRSDVFVDVESLFQSSKKGLFVRDDGSGMTANMFEVTGAVKRLDEEALEWESKRRTATPFVDEGISWDTDTFWDSRIFLQVDLSFPIKLCLAEVESALREARREYKNKHGHLPSSEKRPRRRLDQYEHYLRVWDLKQEGKSLSTIAKLLYPGMAASERVKDHYRRAKELIGGGYRGLN